MKNGTLQYAIVSGGGIDSNHLPVAVATSWSDPIDCLIITNTHNNKGTYQDGKFTVCAYEIHIEKQAFSAKRVKLTNSRSVDLGEFQVQDVQFLDLVRKVKILV